MGLDGVGLVFIHDLGTRVGRIFRILRLDQEAVDCCLLVVLVSLWVAVCLPANLGPVATFLVSLSGAGTSVGLAERSFRCFHRPYSEPQ